MSKGAYNLNASEKTFSFFPYSIDFSSCVVTIGNFDGCHLGHQKLIRNNCLLGEKFSCPNLVLTFDPRPQNYLKGTQDTKELLPKDRKTRALKEFGVSHHYVLNFNDELNHTKHEIFYQKFLREYLNVRAITVGQDFHFGFQRKGTALWLKEQGERDGIHVDIIPSLLLDKEPVSSTRIRKLLSEKGDIETATKLLGHRYSLEGKTIQGEKVGRTIGFPTLNLDALNQLIPADGVYCGYVWLQGLSQDVEAPIICMDTKRLSRAIFSIGVRPTFKTSVPKLCIEAHILDPMDTTREHYDLKAVFYFEKKLRDMITFRSSEDLAKHIAKDISLAQKIL